MTESTGLMQVGPLYLASSDCAGLTEWLGAQRRDGPVVVLPWASERLADQRALLDPVLAAVAATGAEVQVSTRADAAAAAIADAGAVVMPGGDPFHLLQRLAATGAARLLSQRHGAGLPVAGQSAGAMVCAPTLAPATLTSPFLPAPGQTLEGLGLTAKLVLPHHDRPGRAARHRQAAERYAGSADLVPLWDGEVLFEALEGWCIRARGVTTRPAAAVDAASVAGVFRDAAATAWAPFVGAERVRGAPDDTARWAERIVTAGDRFLVAEDPAGIVGFVLYGAAPDDDLAARAVGEVDLLYTLPRAWGLGIGRRLLDRATFALLVAGFREAVLWTEHRNLRALAVYRRNGWVPDGRVRERDYRGASIRELRHRLPLGARAGGADDVA